MNHDRSVLTRTGVDEPCRSVLTRTGVHES